MVIDLLAADRLDDLEPLWDALREHHGSIAPDWLPETRPHDESWRLRCAQYERWLRNDDAFALLARDDEDGRALGYAFVVLQEGSSPTWPLGERLAEVETLAVLPEARGAGVGGALLDAVRAEAARRGAQGISLLVIEGNDGATRFYEREGFRTLSRLLVAPIDPSASG